MFLTMQEYLTGAKKLLALYGYSYHKKDEDAISYVANAMMHADEVWDSRSSRNSWRFTQAKFAIMKLKTKQHTRKRMHSLNAIVGHTNDKPIYLQDMLSVPKNEHLASVYEEFMTLLTDAKTKLSPKQFECLQLHYEKDMTLEKIGVQMGISKQMVSLHIKKAIQILQDEYQSTINHTSY